MSSRALRRLQQDSIVIKVPVNKQEDDEEEEEELIAEGPGFTSAKSKKPAFNPFAVVANPFNIHCGEVAFIVCLYVL